MVLILAGIVFLMAAILVGLKPPRYKVAFDRLSSGDFNRVTAELKKKKIPYQVQGKNILVPEAYVNKVRAEAVTSGAVSTNGIGLDLFGKPNLTADDFVQRVNATRALQSELEHMIKEIKGIEDARVLIYKKEDKLASESQGDKPKASVMVDTAGHVLNGQVIVGIRNLVAKAVGGLAPEDVQITDNHGVSLSDLVNEER